MEAADTTVPDGGRDAGDGTENTLVLGSPGDGGSEAYCAERLSAPPGTATPNALLVSLDTTPDRRIDAMRRRGVSSSKLAVVCCESTRGGAAARPAGDPDVGPGPWIATVPSPGDLTGLGVRIEEALSGWVDEPDPVELCFHSLTVLCQYVDVRAAFRFCHAVTRHLDSAGAGSYFHLDPGTVDQRTVATLSTLFDRVEDRR